MSHIAPPLLCGLAEGDASAASVTQATFEESLEEISILLVDANCQLVDFFPSTDTVTAIERHTANLHYFTSSTRFYLPAYDSFRVSIWVAVVELEIDKHLLMLMEKLSPMLGERQPVGKGVDPSRGSSSSDIGRGMQRDRMTATSKALHTLRERRLQADPYRLELTTVLSTIAKLLTTLLQLVGRRTADVVGEAFLRDRRLSDFLGIAMQHMLRCTRAKNTQKTCEQAVSPQGSNKRAMRLPKTGQQPLASCEDSNLELVWLTNLNVCTATVDLLTKVSFLPEDQQVQTFSSLPNRFLDTLCCLTLEGVADVLPLFPSAVSALVRMSVLHSIYHEPLTSYLQAQPVGQSDHSRVAAIMNSLGSSYMLRLISRVFVQVTPSGPHGPINSHHPDHQWQSSFSITHDPGNGFVVISILVAVLHKIILRRVYDSALQPPFRELSGRCCACMVQDGAFTGREKAKCGAHTCVDSSGPWVLTQEDVGMASLVSALSRQAATCAAQAPMTDKHVKTVTHCLHIVNFLTNLARKAPQYTSMYAPGAGQLRGCLRGAAQLSAAVAKALVQLRSKSVAGPNLWQVQTAAHQLASGHTGCCKAGVCSKHTEEDLLRTDFKKLVLGMLDACSLAKGTPHQYNRGDAGLLLGRCFMHRAISSLLGTHRHETSRPPNVKC